MFSLKLQSKFTTLVSATITRNKGSVSDPVQKLFVDKIREYRQKGGKLVDPSPAILKELKAEFAKLEKHYGGGSGVDMTAFPTFAFGEPKLDPIDETIPESKQPKKDSPKSKPPAKKK